MKYIPLFGLLCLLSCQKQDLSKKIFPSPDISQGKTTSTDPSKTIGNGLVAYYPFSGNANDASGHGYNGTVYGAKLTKDRFNKLNSAYLFSGLSDALGTSVITDNSIQVTNFNYSFGNKISISLWVNMANTVGDFLNRRVDNAIDFDCTQYNTSIYGHFGAVGYTNGTKTVSLNTWHNYIYVYDGTALKLYLDGILDAQIPASGNISNYTSVLNIGKYVYHGGSTYYQFYNGKLDEIRFYNRQLTTTEISYLATH
jgi:hypothetical protein